MIKEIYIRTPEDPYYEEGIIDFSNEAEEIITQLKVLLGTTPGDVLGEPNFGIDLDYLVFGTRRNSMSIEKDINEAIDAYIPHSNNISISVKMNFGKSDLGGEYGVLDVYLNGVKSVGFLVDKN
jgi:hypothetical protein